MEWQRYVCSADGTRFAVEGGKLLDSMTCPRCGLEYHVSTIFSMEKTCEIEERLGIEKSES